MSRTDLDTRDLLESLHAGIAHILGTPTTPPITPQLLSRHYTVFQIPSATTPNHYYLVAGSKKDGWRCTCIGFQANPGKPCYHARCVAEVMRTAKHPHQRQARASALTRKRRTRPPHPKTPRSKRVPS